MIDFNQDIAPYRQQFFPMLAGKQGFDSAMQFHQTVYMPMQEQLMKLRQQDLAYRTQKLAFREKRDDMRREREANEAIPMIEDRLREIRTSDATAMEKREAFTDLAMSNVGLINNSPSIASLFSFQDTLLKNRMTAEAKEQQKQQAFRNQSANDYRQGTLRVGVYDEEVYKGILDGTVSDQDVSNILTTIAKDKKLQEELNKKKADPLEIEFAEDYLKDIRAMQYEDVEPSKDGQDPYKALKPNDYRKAIGYLSDLLGEEESSQTRLKLIKQFPEQDPDKLLNEITRLAKRKILSFKTNDTSFLTERGKENLDLINRAFGITP